MKVFVFFTFDVSLKVWSDKGLLERELCLYENYADCGHEIFLLTYGFTDDLLYYNYPNITVLPVYSRIPYSNFLFLRFLASFLIPLFFSPYLKSSDVIKTNQTWGAHVAIISKFLFNKPLLARSGYDFYQFFKEKSNNLFFRSLVFVYSSFTFKFADKVHVSTQREKDSILTLYHQATKSVSVVPNWIDSSRFLPNSSTKSHRLLYIGRLSSQKNLEFLFRVLAKSNVALDIVGDGELKEELVSLSEALHINVRFLGTFSNKELPCILDRYKFFILPSLYEGNPKSLLEAMSAGLIVLGSNIEGIKNIITDNVNGFLFDINEHSLLDCLDRSMCRSSHEHLEQISISARNHILSNHSFSSICTYEIACLHNLQS